MSDAFFNPLGISWLVMMTLAVWLFRKPDRRGALVLGSLCLMLLAFGGTPFSAWLVTTLETPRSLDELRSLPKQDAVVVLGGSYWSSPAEPSGFKVNASFDRITTGLNLIDRQVAPHLVLGGGIRIGDPDQIHDSEALKPWLRRRMPLDVQVHVLPSSQTTRDEAVHFAEVASRLGWHRIALVTSASHLGRAAAVFRAQGVIVEPVGCAFEGFSRLRNGPLWTIIPNNLDLRLAGIWLHEVIGQTYYRLRGWESVKTGKAG